MWFIKYGITTYEYILEQREILDLEEKLKDGTINYEKFQIEKEKLIKERTEHKE